MTYVKYGFISSHQGGQHTNGPDYGVMTAEHELAGVKIEIQTSRQIPPHKARTLAAALIDLAIEDMRL